MQSSSDAFSKGYTKILFQIIDVLNEFSKNIKKRLNFEYLAMFFKLSPQEADELLLIIFRFQELFGSIFKDFSLKKKIVHNKIYLVAEKNQTTRVIPKKVRMLESHLNLFNDIIYVFKFVKRGKGFDANTNGTDLLKNVRELFDYYPYFFQEENGLVYPSELGLNLGDLILSYKKSNKLIDILYLNDMIITVEQNE
ncbi:MAG: hypothetical protein ACFFEN_08570 [Candidatus Thorarchaeota archaeon]